MLALLTEVVVPAALFLLAVELCALAVWPLAWRVFDGIPDRGFSASKVLGPLLLAYCLWLPSMLGWLGPLRGTSILVLATVGVASWLLFGSAAREWAMGRRADLVRTELLFVGLFGLGVFIRMFNAAILGQEKFMDMALMNAFMSTNVLPTDDPWLAGYGVPYYHFSYYLLASLGKLAGIAPAYAYSLSLVYVFAAAGTCAGSLVWSLVRLLRPGRPDFRIRQGWMPLLLGAFFVVLSANLVAPLELIAARGLGPPGFWGAVGVRNLAADPSPDGLLPSDGGWWFHAARVIPNIEPDGITEFPYFSFLLGDLHPHYAALTLDLLVLLLSLNVLTSPTAGRAGAQIATAAVALGSLLVANTWDVPAFWGLYGLCVVLAARRELQLISLELALRIAVPFGLAVLLYLPFFIGAQSPPLGLGLVRDRTPLLSMLILFAPIGAVLAVGLRWLWLLGFGPAGTRVLDHVVAGQAKVLGGAALALLFGLLLLREGTLFLLALFAMVLVPLGIGLLRRDSSGPPRSLALLFIWLLCGMGLAILVGTELIYLSDVFASRMNTVFKFHYNAWLLLALAAGFFATLAVQRSSWPRAGGRVVARAVVAAALALGVVYPLAATYAKSSGFRALPTLNGAAFLEDSRPGDYAAVEWLRRENPGRPVVLEAVGGDYSEHGRISTFSGLPTVLGWPGHELQWRGPIDELAQRQDDVTSAYTATEQADLEQILARYQVRFVVVGDLERAAYGDDLDERLESWLPIAFQQGTTTVYRAPRSADPRLAAAQAVR